MEERPAQVDAELYGQITRVQTTEVVRNRDPNAKNRPFLGLDDKSRTPGHPDFRADLIIPNASADCTRDSHVWKFGVAAETMASDLVQCYSIHVLRTPSSFSGWYGWTRCAMTWTVCIIACYCTVHIILADDGRGPLSILTSQ